MKINKFKEYSLKLKLRLFFGVILFFIFLFFLILKIVPGGKISYSFSQSKARAFYSARGAFRNFRPETRIDFKTSEFLKIISDPVYFSVFSPRSFDTAKITLKYQESLNKNTPIIELGILKGGQNGSYELKPLENKIIDSLLLSWNKVENKDGYLILQKEENYKDEIDFWDDFNYNKLMGCSGGVFDCLVFYNYPLFKEYKLAENVKTEPLEINQALRAEHHFFVYFKEGDWFLDFSFRNLRLKDAPNKIEVKLFFNQELLEEKVLIDDDYLATKQAFDNNNRQGSSLSKLEFKGTAKKEGLYKVEIKANDDIVIEQIKSSSNQLVFINRLWPVYEKKIPSFFTEAKDISLKTFEVESLGEVVFANNVSQLEKTYYSLSLKSQEHSEKLKELELENTGVLIELNGVISLNQKNFFNPIEKKIDRFFSLDESHLYLIADYKSPKEENNLKVASLEFDLKGASRDNGFYSFVISVPGLIADPINQEDVFNKNYLGVEEIKIELQGKKLKDKIKERVKEIFNK